MAQNSSSPAAAFNAIQQQGKIGQGMAAGLATARTQEQQGAQDSLARALTARDQMNQTGYLNVLQQQLGLSDEQLRALMGNQQYAAQMAQTNAQADSAKWNALSGLAGGLAPLIPGYGKH
jgi:hypothetical protein